MSAALQPLCDAFNARAGQEGWPVVCDRALAFDSGRLTTLLEIWRAVKGVRPLPLRSDFSARVLVRHLRDISFIERLGEAGQPRRYRFRFVGSGQVRGGADPTGKYLDAVIGPQFIATWYAAYDMVLELAAPLRFVSQFHSLKLDFLTAESLVAPLCDAGGQPAGLLTSTVYSPRQA